MTCPSQSRDKKTTQFPLGLLRPKSETQKHEVTVKMNGLGVV
ncbi:hypothetical protein Q31b_39380 [Novipirellula aureliae]|uniref:Uncharacterized protein n=1 Tax=Novipirellula aureliae TaxID=2527966 RepID=A0A5C6DPV7_9BACT|nr:hypothetical protein Q31b_39380 [Novipirellula aureliae]